MMAKLRSRRAWQLGIACLLAVLVMALLTACASTRVTRVDTGTVTDLSGRWNDTDSRLVAEAMLGEALNRPWLDNFSRDRGRQPVVVVDRVTNRSHEHINTQTFVNDLERELTNEQRVQFIAKDARAAVRAERQEQTIHAEATAKRPGMEISADFMLQGTINTIPDESDGTKAVLYQIDLEMIDIETNLKVWFGQKKIKKVIERRRYIF